MYGGMLGPALPGSVSAVPDSWLIAINNAGVLIAVWLLGLVIYIGVILRWRKRRRDAELRAVADAQPSATVPDDGQTITVYAKKSEVALYILQFTLSTSIFTAIYLWLWSHPQYYTGAIATVLFHLLFGAILLSGVIRLLFGAVRLISRAPVLIVNAAGITDNATFIAAGMGLIPWHEIRQFFIYDRSLYRGTFLQIRSTRTLIFVAKNQTIVRQQALWKRVLHAFNPSQSDVVRIPEFLLPVPLEELRAQIWEYLRIQGLTLPLSRVPAGADTPTSAD